MDGSRKAPLTAVAVMVMVGGALVAQSPLAELGLTEAAARGFVLNEIKTPALGRTSRIASDWRDP